MSILMPNRISTLMIFLSFQMKSSNPSLEVSQFNNNNISTSNINPDVLNSNNARDLPIIEQAPSSHSLNRKSWVINNSRASYPIWATYVRSSENLLVSSLRFHDTSHLSCQACQVAVRNLLPWIVSRFENPLIIM